MQGCPGKVIKDEYNIKLSQAKLDTLKRGDLDFSECDDKERGIREMYEAFRSWLQLDISTEWHALEREFAERNVKFETARTLQENSQY